jgi:hypothetical protein
MIIELQTSSILIAGAEGQALPAGRSLADWVHLYLNAKLTNIQIN